MEKVLKVKDVELIKLGHAEEKRLMETSESFVCAHCHVEQSGISSFEDHLRSALVLFMILVYSST